MTLETSGECGFHETKNEEQRSNEYSSKWHYNYKLIFPSILPVQRTETSQKNLDMSFP